MVGRRARAAAADAPKPAAAGLAQCPERVKVACGSGLLYWPAQVAMEPAKRDVFERVHKIEIRRGRRRLGTGSSPAPLPILSRNAFSLNSIGSVDRTHSNSRCWPPAFAAAASWHRRPRRRPACGAAAPARACSIRPRTRRRALPFWMVPSVAPPSLISTRYGSPERGLRERGGRAPAGGPCRRESGCSE